MWISWSFLLPVLLLLAAPVATGTAESKDAGSTCRLNCGGVDIRYPFGIGPGCFRPGFEIICDNKGSGGEVKPRLPTSDQSLDTIPVLNVSVTPRLEATVKLPVTLQCYNSDGTVNGSSFGGTVNFNQKGVYRISSTRNELYILGSNTLAYTRSGKAQGSRGFNFAYYAGCLTYTNDSSSARDGVCNSIGCCQVEIPPDLSDNQIVFFTDNGTWSRRNPFYPCEYAFIVERGSYTFEVSDLTSMPLDMTMPLVLDGAIRDHTANPVSCAQAANKTEYACRSSHSKCFDSDNGPGYICNCTHGYEGNPYLDKDGECTNINECKHPEKYPCFGICKDTDGSHECECPPGHDGDPTIKPCKPTLPRSAKISIGISMGTFLIIVILLGTWLVFNRKELKEKKMELKAAAERNNGSERLKNVKTLELFTPEQVYKITKDNSIPLGRGGFGEVYKGTLQDKTEVAVKASINVNKDTVDEFVREVEIQSGMMHRNILKLLGCCLQVDVPLLVYEYAAKGTLQDILHGKETDEQCEPFVLNSRLDIAIGSAQGLAYMHSFTQTGIQHADVKPSNILIDAGLVPKISDFGLSKMFRAGTEYTIDVRGHLDYMDPMSIIEKRLTPKGDVYSFGIVLLELICRKPVVYGGLRLLDEYKKIYEQDGSGRSMFDKEIANEEDIPILEEIGLLAMKCLKLEVAERPAMVSVASALVMLKDSWEEKHN